MKEKTKENVPITLNFTPSAHEELTAISVSSGKSIPEIFRLGLGFFKVFVQASRDGQRVMLVDKNNNAVKEIIFPK